MRYRLKKKELLQVCIYMINQRIWKKEYRGKWLSAMIVSVFFLVMGWWELAAAIVFIGLFWYAVRIFYNYRANVSRGILGECVLSLEHGFLVLGTEAEPAAIRIHASSIEKVTRSGSLIYIIFKGITGYIIFPERAFPGESEKNNFLAELAKAASRPAEQEEGTEQMPCEEPLYAFAFFADKAFLVDHFSAIARESLDHQKYYGTRIFCAVFAGVAIGILFLKIIYRDQISWKVLGMLAIVGVLTGILTGRKKNIQKKSIRRIEKMALKGEFLDMLGAWQVFFHEHCVRIKVGERENCIEYRDFQNLLDSAETYVFYGGAYKYSFSLPKQAVPPEEKEKFFNFCCEKFSCRKQIVDEPHRKRMSQASRILLGSAVVLMLTAAGMLGMMALEESSKTRNYTRKDSIPVYDADFKFRPSEYPDYLPIEKQIQVLKQLGFEVPEGAADYYHSWMEGNEYGKLYVEGYPFYVLLSDLGTPNYDMDSYQFLGYSEQVYWFACESWDISKDYEEILNGVKALTQGEADFIGISEDCEKVNWKEGSGYIRVTFWCKGHPHEFKANVDGDWLDMRFIAFLNEVFQQEGLEKRIYTCPDNDQGCILFYQDEVWAEKFTEYTGIELSLKAE